MDKTRIDAAETGNLDPGSVRRNQQGAEHIHDPAMQGPAKVQVGEPIHLSIEHGAEGKDPAEEARHLHDIGRNGTVGEAEAERETKTTGGTPGTWIKLDADLKEVSRDQEMRIVFGDLLRAREREDDRQTEGHDPEIEIGQRLTPFFLGEDILGQVITRTKGGTTQEADPELRTPMKHSDILQIQEGSLPKQ